MSAAMLVCPACQTALRLPAATPAGRVRCPRCKEIFSPLVDAEELSESVAVVLDAPAPPRDADDSFFDEVAESKPDVAVPAAPKAEPRKPKREPEPIRSGNGVAIAFVSALALVSLCAFAGASYIAYAIIWNPTHDEVPEGASGKAGEKASGDVRVPEASLAKVKAATILVRTKYPDGPTTTSSGFFVPGPGLVLTNARSVGQGKKPIAVSKIDVVIGSRTLAARLLGSDADLDLSLLQVAGLDLPEPLALGADTFALKEGLPVVVFSVPPDSETRTVTATNATIGGQRTVAGTRPWFVLSGWIPNGGWGGPVADSTGRIVGVAGVIPGSETVSAVPAETVHAFVQNAIKSVESSGPVAMSPPESSKKKPRDDPDPNAFPEAFPGRQQFFPPGFEPPMLPFPAFPPGAVPPALPPGFEGRFGRPGMRPDPIPKPREPKQRD